MAFEPWMLAAMEDEGYMDASHGLNMKIAKYLAKNGSNDIGDKEFTDACISCNVNPDSIKPSDLRDIQDILNKLT